MHARTLFAVAVKPCIATTAWRAIRSDIEGLANSLQGYSNYLESALQKQQKRQQQDVPVRTISDNIVVSCHPTVPISQLTADQKRFNDIGC